MATVPVRAPFRLDLTANALRRLSTNVVDTYSAQDGFIRAHRGALVSGVPTVAFVGYGFGATYPPEHAALEEAIVVAGGAVATLCPPETPVSDGALIARDQLQAQHASAVVLVCSELEGGAMHTMRFARELQKPRFAVVPPDDAQDPVWAGNRACIEAGATPLPFDVDATIALLRA